MPSILVSITEPTTAPSKVLNSSLSGNFEDAAEAQKNHVTKTDQVLLK
jgi:hypothetical protein